MPGGARVFARLLAGAGVIVRTFCGRAGLEDCVRIGVPDDDEGLRRLVAALECVLRPEALLFDMDGVLVDVSASYRAAIVETALRFGVSLTSADVAREKARGDANDDWALTARLIAARGREAPLDEVTRVFEALYQGAGDVPGLAARERAMFSTDELARVGVRARLGVVTGRPRRDAERFLRTARQDEHFAVVVAREDAPLKPAPDPVALAMARLGVTRAWMFGDTVDDVRAARAAGVLAIGVVAPGEADRVEARRALEAAGAALVVDEPRALLEVLP